jgi:hypothetical protein
MVKYFQISKKNSIFSTSLGGMTKFFQIQKQKKFNSNFKNDFLKFSFQNFLVAQTIFFLGPRLANLLKNYENYLFTL